MKAFINHLKRNRIENLVYLALWIIIFTAPIMNMYVRVVNVAELDFLWDEVIDMWRYTCMFLVAFVINNALLNAILIKRRDIHLYLCMAVLLLVVFTAFQSFMVYFFHDAVAQVRDSVLPQLPGAPIDIVSTVVVMLLMGMNLGVKLFFKLERDSIEMQLVENQNLEHQLAYLRYQINPHFYMNTLNNIHALVDINPEKAKTTIVELSKMLRYVLYDANRESVSLKKEIEFLRHYFRLMSLRFTDDIKTSLTVPERMADCNVPPLLLIIFAENAFKHGISYSGQSFVDVSIDVVDGNVVFTCSNSKHTAKPTCEKGGVGLVNVRKRLDLLYDTNYKLEIKDSEQRFDVKLVMPVLKERPQEKMENKGSDKNGKQG